MLHCAWLSAVLSTDKDSACQASEERWPGSNGGMPAAQTNVVKTLHAYRSAGEKKTSSQYLVAGGIGRLRMQKEGKIK